MEICTASIDLEHFGGDAVEYVTVVGDEEKPATECGESFFEIRDGVEIEVVRGFVENESVPFAAEKRCKGDALGLATRELIGSGIEHVSHAEPEERSFCAPRVNTDACRFTHGPRGKHRVLREDTDPGVAARTNLARIGGEFAGEDAQQGAFPAAIQSHDADAVACRDGDGEVAKERSVRPRGRYSLRVKHDHDVEDMRTPSAYDLCVGFFERRRQRKEQAAAQQAAAVARAAQADRTTRLDTVDTMIDAVERSARGELDGLFEGDDGGVVLKAGEFAIAKIQGSALLETTRAPSTYQGGYGGVSFPLFGGIRLNTGGVRGKRIPGKESLTYVEDGETVITNVRAVFLGANNTVEWPFARVIACEHNEMGYTTFGVTGRKKNSGFGYGTEVADEVQFRVEWGIALCNGTTDRLLKQLRAERQHLADVPGSLPPPSV